MHATIEQLLDFRDGNASDLVCAHVAACEVCRLEAERLADLRTAMRAIPAVQPPALAWADVVATARRRQISRSVRTGLAVAASVALVAVLAGSLIRVDDRPQAIVDVADETADRAASEPDVESLIVQSQQLESLLQRLPSRPAVVRAGTDSTIASLTTSIAMVDYTLGAPAGLTEQQSRQLWQQRVGLMDSLVKVRFAEASQANL